MAFKIKVDKDGNVKVIMPDGIEISDFSLATNIDGLKLTPSGELILPDGSVVDKNGNILMPDGNIVKSNGINYCLMVTLFKVVVW